MQNFLFIPANIEYEFTQNNKSGAIYLAGPYAVSTFKYTSNKPISIVFNTFLFHNASKFSYYQSFFKIKHMNIPTLLKLIISAYTGYKRYLRIRGTGYQLKPNSVNNTLSIVAGFSFNVNVKMYSLAKLKTSRKFSLLRAHAKYLTSITNDFAKIRQLRKSDVYRGIGIYYRYTRFVPKSVKKKKSGR